MAITAVTDSNFENDVLKSNGLVLVDFWAEWCAPCKALGPKLEEISDEMAEKVNIKKVDIVENPDSPAKYQVRGIPTMILFKEGKMVDQVSGNIAKEKIVEFIERNI